MKPSPLTRLKAAYEFYKNGWRKFQPRPQATKKIPFIWPNWYNGQPQWQLINYEAYVNEGFNANAIIYSAIMYKTRAATLAPLKAYTGTPEQPELLPPNHWLQSLCLRPNPFQSWAEFNSQAWVYWLISGNNFTVFSRAKNQIMEMYNLRPDRVFIIPTADKKRVIGFWYVPEGRGWTDGIPYLPQDVMHNKLPNPGDPLDGLGYGLSPLSPAAHSGDVDNDLTKFFRLFFKAGAMPSGLLSFDVPMQDDEVAAARRRWNEVYGGSENWAEESVAVLDQGGKYQRIGFSFQEMDVTGIDARNESRITGPFGVPLTLIESRPQLVQSTYSNKETDRILFWEDTMEPELNWWQSDWQYYLQGDDGSFVMYDLSNTPAFQKRKLAQADRFEKALSLKAVTVNEYRAVLGLDPNPDLMEQPTEIVLPDETMPEVEEDMEESPVKKKAIKSRADFAAKSDQLATDYEAEFSQATSVAFEADLRYILAVINDTNTEARQNRASLNWDTVTQAITTYLTGASLASWQQQMTSPVSRLMSERVADLNSQFNQHYPAADLLAQEWFNEYLADFAGQINNTTSETVQQVIDQAITEGWSVPTTEKRLEGLFRQWQGLDPGGFVWPNQQDRLKLIASTETMKAVNLVSYCLYGVWNVQFHEWVSVGDNRVRPDHRETDGQVVRVGQPFNVGGWPMLYPGDPAGPPEEVINCRCWTTPRL